MCEGRGCSKCLIPAVCSVWLPLCSYSWCDVNGGLSEFQTLAVFLPAGLFDLSLISQDFSVGPVIGALKLGIHQS
jgi:hypothetical protein